MAGVVEVAQNETTCELDAEGALTSNGKVKDALSFTHMVSAQCFSEGATLSGTLSKAHVSAGLMAFTAKFTVTSNGCAYAFKSESGSFAMPGVTDFEHGTATGKLDKHLSTGSCAKTITDPLVGALYSVHSGFQLLYAAEA